MRLSLYTSVRNVVRMDFPVREMLQHHLPLADEIIVNEGHSDDGTLELVSSIDPKIKVFRHAWDDTPSPAWWARFSDDARRHCTGDWCLKLDCDEFIPEWEFARLHEQIRTASEDILPVKFTNFYGNYRVYHAAPEKIRWITHKWILHRNRPDVHYVGDGSSAQIGEQPWPAVRSDALTLHHFGAVRDAAQMRKNGGRTACENRIAEAPGFLSSSTTFDRMTGSTQTSSTTSRPMRAPSLDPSERRRIASRKIT